MPTPRLALVLVVPITGVIAACGGPRPTPAPTPSPAPTSAPAPAAAPPPAASSSTAPAATQFAFAAGPAAYDVRSTATVEMTAGPAAERGRESVQTAARVRYDVTAASRAITLTGTVDSLTVQASNRVTGGAAVPNGPVLFRGTVDARGARVDLNVPALGCLSPAGGAQVAALAAARETLVHVPSTIAVGTRWRDTTTAPTCRGPLGAVSTTAALYEISSIDGPRVTIHRITNTTLRGSGIAGGRTVTLAGGGAGTATLELDATSGRLTKVDGDTRATITVTLPDGPRTFSQVVRIEVRRR